MARAKSKAPDPKAAALRQAACLNPHPDRVTDPLFAESDFFDRRDLVQVKYEMVRRVQRDGQPVAQSARAFGFSRPSFYQAQTSLQREGLAGLLPKKRGPRGAHKLGPDVVGFLRELLSQEPSLNSTQLAARLRKARGLRVHSRSVERALARDPKEPR
jgi:transposase